MSFEDVKLVISNGIASEEPVAFMYQKGSLRIAAPRIISPYELSDDDETVLGYDHIREGLRRFELSKIIAIETAHDDYIKPIEKEAA